MNTACPFKILSRASATLNQAAPSISAPFARTPVAIPSRTYYFED
jgi:hypothetical protein